jgi:predicted AlkP superfamily phosphohydrolase/phosphomutase
MPAAVVVIGLDAAEATLLERWAAEGELETFSALARRGAVYRLGNSLETLPGAIWPELTTGRSCGKVPLYFHTRQLHTGEARVRPILAEEIDSQDSYWNLASRAGRRVCVIDQVQAVRSADLNGVQLFEWGLHDRTYDEKSHPPELLQEIHTNYGPHPVRSCDRYDGSIESRDALLNDLIAGTKMKRTLACDLMARENWDLFACTLGESHCAGHQFWQCHDEASPWHDPATPDRHRNAMRSIYQQLDESIKVLMDAAGPDATTLIIASHGMGPSRAGYHLLQEFLVRLGLSSGDNSGSVKNGLRHLKHTLGSAVPVAWVPTLRRLAEIGPLKSVQESVGAMRFPLEASQTRATSVPNNRVGAIRLNIRGREPNGAVAAGDDATALIEELRVALHELTCPKSGKPIVERTITAKEAFGADHHPDIPDIMVVFTPGGTPIESCQSDRVGLIEESYFSNRVQRSGDHSTESRLWVSGPNVGIGREIDGCDVLDIVPTILDMLDVPLPPDLDGRPINLQMAN